LKWTQPTIFLKDFTFGAMFSSGEEHVDSVTTTSIAEARGMVRARRIHSVLPATPQVLPRLGAWYERGIVCIMDHL